MFRVLTNGEAELRQAFHAANALSFQTSAARPVVIEFASHLSGATVLLTAALPRLVVDHVTLRLQNAGPTARVTLDATATTAALRLGANHATIANIACRSAGRGGGGISDGIIATGCAAVTFENCDIDNHYGLGLWLIGSTNVTLRGCRLRQNHSAGLACTDGSSGVAVTGCTFTGNDKGVLFSSGDGAQFTNNVFDGNGEGLLVRPGSANVVFGPGNTVRNTTLASGVTVIGAIAVVVSGNQFANNQRSGLLLADLTFQARVDDNVFTANGRAGDEPQMLLQGVVEAGCSGNTLSGGGAGIAVLDSRQVTLAGGAVPGAITGHDAAGLVVSRCSQVVISRLSIRGNLTAVGGAQVSVVDSVDVDLTAVEVAAPPAGGSRGGLDIARSSNVRCGHGSVVYDHWLEGVVVRESADVQLGQWSAGAGGLAIRGRTPLRLSASQRVRFSGDPAAPSPVDGALATSALGISVTGCTDCRIGPGVRVDGQQLIGTGVQFADCIGGAVEDLVVQGHAAIGVTLLRCAGTVVRGCVVDGAVRAAAATGVGLLVNTGCRDVQLLGNRVTRQQGGGFSVTDADDVWIGPGNRALDNAGDGFVLQDTGPVPARRRVTVQSSAAVGRNLAGQSGFRCANVLASFSNVTATRNGGGIVLQRSAIATVVNSISHGNANDRNRDPTAAGSFHRCLLNLATSAGGSWTDDAPVAGDPRFVAAASGNVALAAGSPAIDVGRHATPIGAAVPCADLDLLPRVRGGTVDLGCCESAPAGRVNALDLAGAPLRSAHEGDLSFAIDFGPASAGQPFVLLTTTSGTGPGFVAPGGATAPLRPDLFTDILLTSPATYGAFDGAGRATVQLYLPVALVPLLPPEFTYCAASLPAVGVSNPVVMRFWR